MQSYSDFEEILREFNDAGVKYLVIGAFAVAAYARPRATGDIDIWVESSADNAARVYRALLRFGAPADHLDEQTFTEADIVFQIGVPPIRVDILTGISGVEFADAWPNRVRTAIGQIAVDIIGRDDLVQNKRASARPKDLADIALLEADRK